MNDGSVRLLFLFRSTLVDVTGGVGFPNRSSKSENTGFCTGFGGKLDSGVGCSILDESVAEASNPLNKSSNDIPNELLLLFRLV
ncbi:hypothetical protein D3C80_1702270 [compost metagenome]